MIKEKYRVTERHVLFWGSLFSNWYPAKFVVRGCRFRNSEQYFMYRKAMYFEDVKTAQLILVKGWNPKEAKRLGREVANFDMASWDVVKYEIMYEAVRYKFDANPDMKAILMSFGNRVFVEASPLDKVWGIGLAEDNPDADDECKWLGQNLLGKALSALRDAYAQELERE